MRHFALLLCLFCSNTLAEPVLYTHLNHVDVADGRLKPDSWVVVDGKHITHLGTGATPKDFHGNTIDMMGRYMIPGLIDAHAHLVAGPHTLEVADGLPSVKIDSVDHITRFHALTALAYGITSLKNPGGDPQSAQRYDQKIRSGEWLGPTAVHAGAVIQPPPFGGSAFVYPKTKEEWDSEAKRQASLGMRYFKLYVSLTLEELGMGVAAAKRHGLTPVAHLDGVSFSDAIDVGIEAFEHGFPTSTDLLPESEREAFDKRRVLGTQYTHEWFLAADFSSKEIINLVEKLAETQTMVTMTLAVPQIVRHGRDPLNVLTEAEIAFVHPDSWAASSQFLTMGLANWSDEDFERASLAFEKTLEFTKMLEDAGVPLLIGTDSNGGGPFMAKEMAWHVDAGLSPMRVLELSTRDAAVAMNLGKTGLIQEGYEADIVFLKDNPLDDIRNVASVHSVLVDGRFYHQQELVDQLQAELVE